MTSHFLGCIFIYLYTGWFRAKDTVIHSGEGPIYNVKWRGPFISWANDSGVKIYDTTSNQKISNVTRTKGSPRPDKYRCNLCWETDTILLIGWASSVKIVQVKVCTAIVTWMWLCAVSGCKKWVREVERCETVTRILSDIIYRSEVMQLQDSPRAMPRL